MKSAATVGEARALALPFGSAWIGAAIAMTGASLAVSPDRHGALGAALSLMMLAIAWTDFRKFLVPDVFSGGAFALGLVNGYFADFDGGWDGVANVCARAVAMAGVFLGVRLAYAVIRGRDGIGLGDVKLAGVAGAWLSAPLLSIAIEIAALTAISAHLFRQWRRGRSLRAGARLPFGAFLAVSIWLTWWIEQKLTFF